MNAYRKRSAATFRLSKTELESAGKDDLRKVPYHAGLSLAARALLLLSSICHLVTMTMPKTAKLARKAYGKIARKAEGSIMSIRIYHESITIKGYETAFAGVVQVLPANSRNKSLYNI